MSDQPNEMVRRRFIAGATCPECGAVDRVQRCEMGGRLWMECVACGLIRALDADHAAKHEVVKLSVINRD